MCEKKIIKSSSIKCGINDLVLFMAKTEKYQELKPELRITGVSEKTQTEIINIAKNLGVSMSTFMRPKITEIAASYPEHMKKPPVDY